MTPRQSTQFTVSRADSRVHEYNMSAHKNLETLSNLVAAITQLSRTGSNTEEGTNNNNGDVETTIRSLFPSTNGRCCTTAATSQPSNAASAAAQTSNNVQDTTDRFVPSRNYGVGKKRAKPTKSKVSKKSKTTDARTTLKDVVLIPYSRQTKIPRGREREHIFSSGFCATFELDPSMTEEGIRALLEQKFADKLGCSRNSPMFEFMRAVHSKLISLEKDDSPPCNGRLLKHVSGQGPLYIRAKKDISVSLHTLNDFKEDSSDGYSSQDDNIIVATTMYAGPNSTSSSNLSVSAPPGGSSTASLDVSSDQSSGLSSIVSTVTQSVCTPPMPVLSVVSCPTCNGRFEIDKIEEHADLCSEAAWSGTEQTYVTLMSNINEDNDNDPNSEVIVLADDAQEIEMVPDNPEDIQRLLIDIIQSLQKNLGEKTNRVNVQRISMLDDYLNRRVTCAWFSPKNRLKVVFIGEPAIDDGGPRREFLSGTYLFLFKQDHKP